jgi:hypothetical protein
MRPARHRPIPDCRSRPGPYHKARDVALHAGLRRPSGLTVIPGREAHERDHSRQRHWLVRFRRRTCVVSKAVRMVEASIALFVRFGDSAGIDELLSMLV